MWFRCNTSLRDKLCRFYSDATSCSYNQRYKAKSSWYNSKRVFGKGKDSHGRVGGASTLKMTREERKDEVGMDHQRRFDVGIVCGWSLLQFPCHACQGKAPRSTFPCWRPPTSRVTRKVQILDLSLHNRVLVVHWLSKSHRQTYAPEQLDLDLELNMSQNDDLSLLDSDQSPSDLRSRTQGRTVPQNVSSAEAQKSQEESLRQELANVKRVNEAIEGVLASLDKAKANMKVQIYYSSSLSALL